MLMSSQHTLFKYNYFLIRKKKIWSVVQYRVTNAFSSHASLIFFNQEKCLSFSINLYFFLSFMTLTFLKSKGHVFSRMSFRLGLSDIFSLLDSGHVSLAEKPQKWHWVLLSGTYKKHMAILNSYWAR